MFILNQKIIIGGERWFTPMKDLKPVDGLKLLVASSDNDQYRSRNALIRRHIEKMDASLHVGTKEFDITQVSEVDSIDDLLIDNAARYLLKDWKGVGEIVNGDEVALEYTPERGVALLRQYPEFYWQILAEAASIAQGKEQHKQETVKKPLPPNGGCRSSGGRKGKRSGGSEKNLTCRRLRNRK
ncbi:hypothetical protein ABK178_004642 [Salmonella enterica subsp. enterica serovar Brandenburg]|nr:hypothetical protein [Salmonella enterica subsp. enterica]